MVTRRSFLATSITASAAILTMNPLASAVTSGRKLANFGFISGIIGKELEGDWKALLKKCVEYGFTEIELGKYLGDSASAFLAYCKEIGIRPTVGGISLSSKEEDIQKSLDALDELNIKIAVNYWPWLSGGPFKLDDCKKSVELLNILGAACRKRGITFCWHNHNKEFVEMEEGLPFDFLMTHTDKDLVKCEMDVYWVAKGGADPLALLQKYAGRYQILHLKDMTRGDEKTFQCVGKGTIDFPSILKEAQKQNIMHYFVEYDNVADGMACLKTSGEYLRNLSF
jgi:sugar phosphate isomerase/epimerase